MFRKLLNCIVFFYLVLSLNSCKQENKWVALDIIQSAKEIVIEDCFYKFDSKLPINLSLKDSIIFINFTGSTHALSALNINTKSLVDSFGNIGNGPEEVISPEFIYQTSSSDVTLSDVSSKRIMAIVLDSIDMKYGLRNIMNYPNEIYPASDIAMSNTFITGRNLRSEDAMFFIYNKNDETSIDIPFYPSVKYLESRRNYFYATRTAINENANRIISANYFFNMFHVYSLKGDHIQSFSLSENPIPNINMKSKELDINNKYTGIQALFATDNYCYMMVKTKNSETKENVTIVQSNWNGKILNSFQIVDDLVGGFCVDEGNKRMYGIIQDIDNKEDEIYKVVSYLFN